MGRLAFNQFDVLTFDCYGTLIDWETGIAQALRPALAAHGVEVSDEGLLEAFARHEAALEAGDYLPYREILSRAFERLSADFGVVPRPGEAETFAVSVGDWPAFDDSAEALARLKTRFKLGVVTNCDDDLFARSNARLGVTFDWIITAQQARSYKPSRRNFELAFSRIGVPRERILHVAQSLYHDHVPAKELGLTTIWVNRRHDKPGAGATPPAAATPDLIVPDMKTLAEAALA